MYLEQISNQNLIQQTFYLYLFHKVYFLSAQIYFNSQTLDLQILAKDFHYCYESFKDIQGFMHLKKIRLSSTEQIQRIYLSFIDNYHQYIQLVLDSNSVHQQQIFVYLTFFCQQVQLLSICLVFHLYQQLRALYISQLQELQVKLIHT
ncbi:hypothetical protein TTHERM_000729009 (macronuclear) [Tetrahymena thermophila SB210]|uniref:Uncharacterized protein n=1 Tax=Tetrahymena thermophila (strain SB210) TaxID=312017 RepID=W7X8D8_TETTS|nr:hypothetical protein TTHERM_000729009 [Tetrahymena thermophila SB210]EWS72673.1 hypothetical protein TTHERM_000729009 [Tetrahymena thermophila SB210]|eukprot:XP_012654798.1 hypothetical protein TTHERM_000729009 [Tetrahymena thermophila SB210]